MYAIARLYASHIFEQLVVIQEELVGDALFGEGKRCAFERKRDLVYAFGKGLSFKEVHDGAYCVELILLGAVELEFHLCGGQGPGQASRGRDKPQPLQDGQFDFGFLQFELEIGQCLIVALEGAVETDNALGRAGMDEFADSRSERVEKDE